MSLTFSSSSYFLSFSPPSRQDLIALSSCVPYPTPYRSISLSLSHKCEAKLSPPRVPLLVLVLSLLYNLFHHESEHHEEPQTKSKPSKYFILCSPAYYKSQEAHFLFTIYAIYLLLEPDIHLILQRLLQSCSFLPQKLTTRPPASLI